MQGSFCLASLKLDSYINRFFRNIYSKKAITYVSNKFNEKLLKSYKVSQTCRDLYDTAT